MRLVAVRLTSGPVLEGAMRGKEFKFGHPCSAPAVAVAAAADAVWLGSISTSACCLPLGMTLMLSSRLRRVLLPRRRAVRFASGVDDFNPKPPKRWQVVVGQTMGAITTFWILYRFKEDGAVMFVGQHRISLACTMLIRDVVSIQCV